MPTGFQPVSTTFVSASEGWVLGTAPCAHAPCTSVVRTTDGGRTWVGIPAPKYPLSRYSFSKGLNKLRFADASDGFAYGSHLWVTRIAGLGAVTLHGTAAWIFLGNRLYSSQTGSHWVRDSITCPANFALASVGAYSAQRITALCVGNAALGSTEKILYSSADGGHRFIRVGTAPAGGDGGLLAEATPRHVFVASSSAATWIYVSTDGGRHWRTSLFLDDGGKGWSDFGFTTATQGIAIDGRPFNGSYLYITRNAGTSWHKVRF